jgi:hypothetical protein
MFTVSPHSDTRPTLLLAGGEYDHIVCHHCEQSFKEADDYFLWLCRNPDIGQALRTPEGLPGMVYSEIDQPMLQRFFLTCLMRAHLSDRSGFQNVDLGLYAERFRQVLMESTQLVADIPVTVIRESHRFSRAMHLPYREKFDGVKFWRIVLPHFSGFVMVGKIPRERAPLLGLSLGLHANVWMPDIDEVSPGLMRALNVAYTRHKQSIDTLVERATRAKG